MLYSKQRNLADEITEKVLHSPYQIKRLHEELSDRRQEPSLRAVYKAVDQLISAGVLIKAGKVVRIDEEWVRTMQIRLTPAPSLSLGPTERMIYTFTSISHLDSFWTTIAFQLESLEKDGEIFFYNPHNFWAYIPERKASEDAYYRHFAELKLHAFFTIGGESLADSEYKRAYQDAFLQIDTRTISSLSRTDHITVMGDYVITVRIGKSMATQIDQHYASGKPIQELLPSFTLLFEQNFPSRFVLENNRAKAEKLKKILSRNFYFPKLGDE